MPPADHFDGEIAERYDAAHAAMFDRSVVEPVVERLAELGLNERAIGRIHAPIGLPINAKSPAEIAISIMAQVTQVRRGAPRRVPDAEAAA